MNSRLKHRVWLFPLIYLLYYGCVTLFVHTHIEDGTAIVHSHPFKKSADGGCHEHATSNEIFVISQLSSFFTDNQAYALATIIYYQIPLIEIVKEEYTHLSTCGLHGGNPLRAPPFHSA